MLAMALLGLMGRLAPFLKEAALGIFQGFLLVKCMPHPAYVTWQVVARYSAVSVAMSYVSTRRCCRAASARLLLAAKTATPHMWVANVGMNALMYVWGMRFWMQVAAVGDDLPSEQLHSRDYILTVRYLRRKRCMTACIMFTIMHSMVL